MINKVALPDRARSKLNELIFARGAAEDAARSCNARLVALPGDADPQLKEKLAAERDKQSHRHNQYLQLTSRLTQWWSELKPDIALQPVPPLSIDAKSGHDLIAAINSARQEITGLKQQLQTVKQSPLPRDAQKKLVSDYVGQLLRQARPVVNVLGDKLRVSYKGDPTAVEDVMSLLAWLHPQEMIDALVHEIPERPGALPQSERVKRTAELEGKLLSLERLEESLVERAHADGLDLPRRVDASPLAVLNIALVAAKEVEAA